jgi:hypothetical protein
LYHVCIMQSSQPCPTTHAGGRTLFKWRQNARYLNGARMRVI